MAKEVFAVDGDKGQITTKVRLDRETKSVSGGGIKSKRMDFIIGLGTGRRTGRSSPVTYCAF